MKPGIFTAVFCAIFALSSGAAHAQDSARVPDTNPDAGSAVDASVHAGIDEQSAQQPQPSRQPNKRQQTTYSHWAFQPAKQPSATRFQPEQTASALAQPDKGDNPSTLNPSTRSETPLPDPLRHGHDTPFGISPIAGNTEPRDPQSEAVRGLLQGLNSESGAQLQGLKSISPLPSPFPRNNGFSASLRDKKAEPSEKAPFPSPFSKTDDWSSNPLKAKSQKHTPPKQVDRNKPASSLDSKAQSKISQLGSKP
jgi:hypothetical protein